MIWGGLRPIISTFIIDVLTLSGLVWATWTPIHKEKASLIALVASCLLTLATAGLTSRWTLTFPMIPFLVLQALRRIPFLSGRWPSMGIAVLSTVLILVAGALSVLFPAKASASCNHCGKEGAEARCSACKEVFYCDQSHQKADRKQHKPCCKGIADDPKSIWIEVTEGEGNGLSNTMMNHIFPNKHDGWNYVKQQPQFAHGNTIGPLRSPFSELIGWSVEVYCSKAYNEMVGPSRVNGGGPLNGAGVFLGCPVDTGLSVNPSLSGRIFVTGRRQSDGKPLTSDALFGILNFIWDAMDLYGDCEPVGPHLKRWTLAYKRGTWEPSGGCGGIDVFCTDTERLRSNKKLVHGH
jgi:hypothetical protein